MIKYYQITKKTGKVESIPKFAKGCWINVTDPNEEELNFLSEKFNLDKNNLVDGMDIYENPRFEIENKKIYIYLTAPTNKITHQYVSSFLIVYSEDFFMTLSKVSLEIFEHILIRKKKFITFSSSRNLLRILFSLSRLFEKSVLKIIKEIKTNKTNIDKLKNKDIAKLINDEDKLNNYISSFGATIQTYNKILRSNLIKFIEKDQEVIEDLIIDLNETLNLGKQTLKTISNMRVYYSTKLSNDLNRTVTLLTLFTIFLSIPTLMASVFGMNINLPFQTSSNLLPFLGILVLGIWTLMFFILKHYKLI